MTFSVNLVLEFAFQGGGAAEIVEESFQRNLRAAYKEQLAYVRSWNNAEQLAMAIKDGTIDAARSIREARWLATATTEALAEIADSEVIKQINLIVALGTEVVKKAKDLYGIAAGPGPS